MRAPTQPLDIDPSARGTFLRLGWLWVVIPLILITAAVGWYLLKYTQLGQRPQVAVTPAAGGEKPPWLLNGGYDKYPVEKRPAVVEEDPHAKALAELKRQLAEQQQRDQARQRELDELRRRLAAQPKPAGPASTPPPKTEKRVPMLYVVNTHVPEQKTGEHIYTLAAWSYIPCVVESVVNSEVPGHFTVKTTRPVMDATGSVVLIPQGRRVGAKAASGELLSGNERIPTFALSLQKADGSVLELGEAPITNAAGTNGLSTIVDQRTWRLIWTSIFLGGLQAGQQMVQTGLGAEAGGAVAAGIAQQGNSAARMRLGRAQDTRPIIHVFAGEGCQILTTKPWQLPAAGG
jgi:type IV secretory pathway VirB10-like protein